jgi:hypothetical protein
VLRETLIDPVSEGTVGKEPTYCTAAESAAFARFAETEAPAFRLAAPSFVVAARHGRNPLFNRVRRRVVRPP